MMVVVVVGGDAIYSQDGIRSGVVVRARKREREKEEVNATSTERRR